MPIRILAPPVVAQIAAGEVVEHPASVVKELVENALDAGARSIAVEARGGGLQEIKVQDDGCGIPAAEIPLAFQRHATSKLQHTDDLWNITTLGFRGEALPSIASVAQVVCITRTEEEEIGTEFRIAGGEIQSCTPRGCARGTSMSVRNLFYNTPVRRDYLRSDASEMASISAIVQQYALAYPSVRFTLLLDGRLALRTSGQGNMRDVLIEIYGLETARHLLPIEATYGMGEETITIRGFISPPGHTRSSRNAIHLFVNRRALQPRGLLIRVLEEAYHTLLTKGKYPIAIVDLQVHPSAVDVNIHPTKSEVRFRHASRVSSLLGRAVRQALLDHAGVSSWSELVTSRSPSAATSSAAPGNLTGSEIRQTTLHQQPRALASEASTAGGKRAWRVHSDQWDTGNVSPSPGAEPGTPHAGHPSPDPAGGEGGKVSDPDGAPELAAPPRLGKLPLLRVIGQVGLTYIVAESPDGIYLIDQHAAHERISYERLMSQHQRGQIEIQELLVPQVITMPPASAETLLAHRDSLEPWGFRLEHWGEGMVLARSVPAVLFQENLQAALLEIADHLADGVMHVPHRWREAMLITLACHTSVRAKQALSLDEMREMLRQLEQCVNPLTCPHGRPIMILFPPDQLERQFGRA